MLLLLLLLLAPITEAPGDHVTWHAQAERTGGLVTVTVRGAIAGDWRMYAMDSEAGRPLAVRFEAPASLSALGSPQQAEPRRGHDHHFDSGYTYFERDVTVTQVFRGHASEVPVSVTYMLCNDEVCLPPRTHEMTVRVR